MKFFLAPAALVLAVSLVPPPAHAAETRNWDDGWRFAHEDPARAMMPGFDDSHWRSVRVPHDWSTEEPFRPEYGSGNGYAAGGIGWYRRHFTLDPHLENRRVIVQFDGVYDHAEIWINGQYAGGRPYGYSSFEIDLTGRVLFGSDNVLAVRVDHSRYADSRFYTGSGIYRHVRLLLPEAVHFESWGTAVSTPGVSDESAVVHVSSNVVNGMASSRTVEISAEVLAPSGEVVATSTATASVPAGASQAVAQDLTVSRPERWSDDRPRLYVLRQTLRTAGAESDQSEIPFGIRTIGFDPDRGFLLNGRPTKLLGVCLHHDAGSVGAAVPDAVLERRLRKLRELGVNAIRTSHNPPAPELLTLCDRLGLLVMDEAFDEFTPAKNKWMDGWTLGLPSHYGYAENFAAWSVRDMEDLVRRDRNHPSVIMWSIGNEVDTPNDPFSDPSLGRDFHPQNPPASELVRLGAPLVAAVKRLDLTRPATAALASVAMSDAVGFGDLLDLAGYNYQENRYAADHARYPRRFIFGSENRHDYRAWTAVRDNPYICGQFLWTGIDYLGEAGRWPNRGTGSGLLDLCGFKKPLGWFRESLWSRRPMVYVAASPHAAASAVPPRKRVIDRERRSRTAESWNWPAGSTVDITCYSNCDEVELVLNGHTVGVRRSADATDGVLTWTMPYAAGKLRAIGRTRGQPSAEFALETTGPAAAVRLVRDDTVPSAASDGVEQIEYRIVDAQARRIVGAEVPVTFAIAGPAELLGLGSANLSDGDDPHALTHRTFDGRGLAILRATGRPGVVRVQATAPGLAAATLTLVGMPPPR